MVVGFQSHHRNRNLTEKVTDGNLTASIQAGNASVAMELVPRLPNTDDDDEQQQRTPFLGYGGMSGAGTGRTTVILPSESHSGIPQKETPRSQPRQVGSNQHRAGGGSECGGRLLLCDARPREDDMNTARSSTANTCVRQRRIDHSATPRGSHRPSRPAGPAVKGTGVDSVLPDAETRMVPYTKRGSAARTITRDNAKNGVEGGLLHRPLALQGRGGGRWSEPWSNSGGGVGTTAHQQDLGQVEVPPSCARAIVPRSDIGEGVVVLPSAADLLRAKEPAKPTCLSRHSRHANKSQKRNDTPAPARAESDTSSGNAEFSAQGDANVTDQQEDDETTRGGKAVINHSDGDNRPEVEGGVLSATRGGTDARELVASVEQEVFSESPRGTPSILLTFAEGPLPHTEGKSSTAGGKGNCVLATPPSPEGLLASSSFSAHLDEPVVYSTEPHGTQLAAPVRGTTRADSTTYSTPTGSSPAAAPLSAGFTWQPPSSSPLPRSPPPLRPKQPAPPTTAIADAGADLGCSVELFSTDAAFRDTNDDDVRVLSAPVVNRRRHEDHDRRWPELCAAGQGRAEREDIETPARK